MIKIVKNGKRQSLCAHLFIECFMMLKEGLECLQNFHFTRDTGR